MSGKPRIAVLYGGRSGEHDVSLCSAASVYLAIDTDRYEVGVVGIDRDGRWYYQEKPEVVEQKDFGRILSIKKRGHWLVNHYEDKNKLVLFDIENNRKELFDIVFPVLHGTFCEDGTLQGLLELAMVPYVGADVIGSAVGMDKDVAKRLLREGGVPVVPGETVFRSQWKDNPAQIVENLGKSLQYPLFLKPANAGSSVGIRKVKSEAQIQDALEFCFEYDVKILAEKAVDCREIECAVMGNQDPKASIPGEVIPRHEFYSYEAKYIDPEGADLKIPALLDEDLTDEIRQTAVKAYRLLCCSGMARVDFFLEKGSRKYYLNEINTLPGFTSISMYPKLWEHTGISYKELINRLIELALQRHRDKTSLKTSI